MAALTATSIANLLVTKWRPGILTAANEETVMAKHFFDATAGASKMANQIKIRKLGRLSTSTLAAGDTPTSLTNATEGGSVVNINPTFFYSVAYLSMVGISRLAEDGPAAEAAYKKQLMATMATKVDTLATANVSSLTNIEGGAVNLDQSLMLKSLKTLVTNAKDAFKVGKTRAHFVIHPFQTDALLAIPSLTAADIRGDSMNPNVSGWVWTAWNSTVEESGNIATSAGIANNCLFLEECFASAWNMKPQLLDPQPVEAEIRFVALGEYGSGVLFDEYGVWIKTNSA